ncbi:unnamed protein product [Cylindrotheca closterium]|uniref:Uncharacterized protein n=1 Tax=Cylindrotheca closterium TaxID=2856 RepID=A0AAD2JJU8_9STRA|nr:unnamed protein product [Cylindrotheca closterium]
MAIYAVGEGWTGALGEKFKLQTIPGHYDEDEVMSDFQDANMRGNLVGENADENGEMSGPVMIYAYDDVAQAAVGWGSTAFLDTQGQVHQLGRPQDLMTLFRMNRLPRFIRNWANQNNDPSEITLVGRLTSKLIGLASGGDEGEIWSTARDLSLLKEWTKVDYSKTDETSSKASQPVGDTVMAKITCSVGVTLMLGRSGTLYATGVNNRGQCGVGTLSNNVWAPVRVKGISVSEKKGTEQDEQDQPVVEMALGFQHGYALTQSGQLFSWGKGSRGQLGREMDADQDATARRLNLDFNVVQIASGNHHGTLLTDENKVFIWGKNMGRVPEDEKLSKKSVDAEVPEEILGLPANKKVLRISCGSHHTSILMNDGSVYGIGIASDEAVPLLDPIELVPAGTIELPVKQFEAHFDRTTVIDSQGQVLQFHLWKDEILREHAFFTPAYVDTLLDQGQSIEALHRSWLHTIIVTKKI